MDSRARKRAGAALAVVGVSVVAAMACATSTLQGSLAIVTGPDNGFTMSPPPDLLTVDFVASNGFRTFGGQTRIPSDGGLTLPSQPGSNVDSLLVTGFDDAGDAVVSGSTIPIALDQLSGITLNVFVQRTGQFARLPSSEGGTAAILSAPSGTPGLTTLFSRYLLVWDGSGTNPNTAIYDTLTWTTEPMPPCLALPSLSVASVETWIGADAAVDGTTVVTPTLLNIGAKGVATWLDLGGPSGCSGDADISEASAPDGGRFIQVAGGQTVIVGAQTGSNQTYTNTYIVGGTRASGPTDTVLRISPSGVLSWAHLAVPRAGATAVPVQGSPFGTSGVYVFGGMGSADGGVTPGPDGGKGKPIPNGVEFIGDNSAVPTFISGAIPSPALPADTTTGAGGVALTTEDPVSVLLAGGVQADGKGAPVRVITFSGDGGVTSGTTTDWPELPVTLVTAQVYAIAPPNDGGTKRGSVIVVGSDKTGKTSAFVLAQGAKSAVNVPFHEPRTNAQSILLPNGSLAVVSGGMRTVESFIP